MELESNPALPSPVLYAIINISYVLLGLLVRVHGEDTVPLYSDCRFWLKFSSEELRQRRKKLRKKPKVFYFWDTTKKDCLPCTRCQVQGLVTLLPCQYFRDTVCVNESDWSRHVYQREMEQYTQDYDEEYDEVEGGEDAVMVYQPSQPVTQGPEVYGQEQLEQQGQVTDSPSTKLARSGVRRPFKTVQDIYSDYGKPTFYSSDASENSVERPDRPIVDVIREFLEKNSSRPGMVGDVRNISSKLLSESLTTSSLSTSTTSASSTLFSLTRRGVKFARRMPAMVKKDFGKTNPANEMEYDDMNSDNFGITHREIEITTRSPGEEAFEEIRHLIQEERENQDLEPLQLTLLLSLIVAGILLLILLAVILRNKYRESRFKMLNNTTYHSMSPFHTSQQTAAVTEVPVLPLDSRQAEEVEVSVHPAVARSLKNIRQQDSVDAKPAGTLRQDSTESRATLQSCIVDEKGRTLLRA